VSSPSSSVQQAKHALGQRLREIRKETGLTARELATRAGSHESKCSRLEHGRTPPSDAEIRTYARHCGARHRGMYVEWRRMERAGLKQVHESVAPLFERTRRFRVYQSWVIPGLLQTAAYTSAVLSTITTHSSPLTDCPGWTVAS
jgi:transcriptional regulator with XRE-family HTH domain